MQSRKLKEMMEGEGRKGTKQLGCMTVKRNIRLSGLTINKKRDFLVPYGKSTLECRKYRKE
jgi:hypothetical protein